MRNVRYILASRRGAAWFRDDFGLTMEGFDTQEQFVTVVTQQLRETLKQYEPRLHIIDVDEEHDRGGKVRLVVRCRLRSDDKDGQTLEISGRPGEGLRVSGG